MSNSPMKVSGAYGKFQELLDSDEVFLLGLLASPTQALLANGFSDKNDKQRALFRQVRNEVLEFARKKFKGLKSS